MSYIEPNIASSYKKVPVFGQYLYDYILKHKPKIIVEFGTRFGYSAICMAQALRDLGRGHLYTYDNLEQAEFSQLMEIHANIGKYHLEDWITIEVQDFNNWIERPTRFDLLHVDVNNNGDTIKLLKKRLPKAHIIFEGGIPQRDTIEEMKGKTPIVGSSDYKVLLWEFPGLSKLI